MLPSVPWVRLEIRIALTGNSVTPRELAGAIAGHFGLATAWLTVTVNAVAATARQSRPFISFIESPSNSLVTGRTLERTESLDVIAAGGGSVNPSRKDVWRGAERLTSDEFRAGPRSIRTGTQLRGPLA